MEDNKTSRTLSEEELKKVTGGIDSSELREKTKECRDKCSANFEDFSVDLYTGTCTCISIPSLGTLK